jgi:hypothetical protein
MQISNCIFENNQIAVDENGNSTIADCQFLNNDIAVKIGENSSLINNTISNNQIGVQVRAYNPTTTTISNNLICNNALYNLENLTDRNFEVNTNCFCSTDSTTIETSIFDGYDDITKGLVNYTIYDDSCNNALRVIAKVILEEPTFINNNGTKDNIWSLRNIENGIEINSSESRSIKITNLAGQLVYDAFITPGSTRIYLKSNSGIYIISDNQGNWSKFVLN